MFVNSLSFRFQTEVNSVALSEVSQCGGFRQSLRPSERAEQIERSGGRGGERQGRQRESKEERGFDRE